MNPIPDPQHAESLLVRVFAGGRFAPALEAAFQADLAEAKRRAAREIALLGLLIFSWYALLDPWGAPSNVESVVGIRLIGVMPGLAWLAWAAGRPFFLAYYRPIIYGVALAAGLSIALIIRISTPTDPAYYAYYSGVILVAVAVPTWTYLGVRETAALNLVTSLACLGITGWQYASHPPLVASNPSLEWGLLATAGVMLASCNLMCVLVARNRERQLRGLFLARRSLEAEKLRAEELARVKSEFLARMSHEIRTPLNAVLGHAQIGLREPEGADSHAHFAQIRESGTHLLGLIDDILDFSRLDAGGTPLNEQPFALAPLLESLRADFTTLAQARRLTLTVSAASDLPRSCVGDRARIRQALANLLSNAVKFTERGEVRLQAARENGQLVFVVHDTGIGMDGDAVARLFEPFTQADPSIARRYGGSGLGMAIARQLVDRMGGTLHVDSRVGTGTRVTVRLPLKSPEGRLPALDSRSSAVASPGAVSTAVSTAAASTAAPSTATSPAAAAPAGAPAPRPAVAAGAPDRPAPAKRLAGLTVLAAEDNLVNRRLLEAVLRREGAQVEFGENGREAVALLEQRGCSHYDLVVTDIQMPVMDGYEATREIHARCPTMPVIGLTAFAMAEERERCLAAGMIEHLAKPIDLDTLVAAILRHARNGTPQGAGTAPDAAGGRGGR